MVIFGNLAFAKCNSLILSIRKHITIRQNPLPWYIGRASIHGYIKLWIIRRGRRYSRIRITLDAVDCNAKEFSMQESLHYHV